MLLIGRLIRVNPDIQSAIGTVFYVTLYTEQLISHTRTVLIDVIASLQGSSYSSFRSACITYKIDDILDNALSKQVPNTGHVLAYPFNSASRQCHEVWSSHFPFLYNCKNTLLMRISFMVPLTGSGSGRIFP